MKKNFKTRLAEGIGDAVGEIIISLIFLAIGAGVLAIFGVSTDAEWLDSDLIMLIGIGATVLVIGAVVLAVHAVRKKKKINAADISDGEGKINKENNTDKGE